MDLLYKKQTDFILARGKGIKACLFDDESKQFISNIIPYSRFQENDFFYFDYITNRDRVPISDICCIVIMRSTNLSMLIEELSSPFYSSYIVLFTNQIDPFVLEILAEADRKCLISEIHEIYLDLCKQGAFFYTTNSTRHKRVLDGLSSLIFSLEIAPVVKAIIVKAIPSDDNSTAKLAKELIGRSQQYNFRRAGTVVLLRRGFDMLSPLICDWHYQSLISEFLGCDNGIVRIRGKEYSVNDAFFEANRFSDIQATGDGIKELVRELERNKIKINNHEFEDIEEKAAHSAMVSTHLTIYNTVLELCMPNKQLSEMEMEIIRSGVLGHMDGLDDRQQLKLLLLYFVRRVSDWEEESKKHPKYRERIMKFKNLWRPVDFPYKPTLSSDRDVKLSYEPPLRRIVKHVILNKTKPGSFDHYDGSSCTDHDGESGPVIIFVEGGVTMAEYRETMLQAKKMGAEVYLVSDSIITSRDILNKLDL